MDRKLIDYLPTFSRDFREMKAIMQTEQPEFEMAWENAENLLADQFITTATINGVKRWEKIFELKPKITDTLEERRFAVLSKFNDRPPYTLDALKNILNALCGPEGYTLNMDYNSYTLSVKLEIGNESNYDTVLNLLETMLPANIVKRVTMFNTYQMLEGYTYEELEQYTYEQLYRGF